MIALAAILVIAGCGLLILAALPVRMRIGRRATLMSLGGTLAFFGGSAYVQAVAAKPVPLGSLICVNAIGVFMAVVVRILFAWRLRRNKRDWETRWKHILPKGPIVELFKRYHDID